MTILLKKVEDKRGWLAQHHRGRWPASDVKWAEARRDLDYLPCVYAKWTCVHGTSREGIAVAFSEQEFDKLTSAKIGGATKELQELVVYAIPITAVREQLPYIDELLKAVEREPRVEAFVASIDKLPGKMGAQIEQLMGKSGDVVDTFVKLKGKHYTSAVLRLTQSYSIKAIMKGLEVPNHISDMLDDVFAEMVSTQLECLNELRALQTPGAKPFTAEEVVTDSQTLFNTMMGVFIGQVPPPSKMH